MTLRLSGSHSTDLGGHQTPGATRATRVASTLAGLFVVTGLLALVGFAAGIDRLTAPIPGWTPMRPIAALAAIGLGLGLWGRVFDRRRLVIVGVAPTLVLGISSLLALAFQIALPAGGLPAPSAVLITTAAVGLLGGTSRIRPGLEQAVLGMVGLGLIALSVTNLFARTTGIYDPGFVEVEGTSFQLAVLMALLGGCILWLVWSADLKELEWPAWLPAAAGLGGLIAVISLWSGLVDQERGQVAASARAASQAGQRHFLLELDAVAGSLRRTGERRLKWAPASLSATSRLSSGTFRVSSPVTSLITMERCRLPSR